MNIGYMCATSQGVKCNSILIKYGTALCVMIQTGPGSFVTIDLR